MDLLCAFDWHVKILVWIKEVKIFHGSFFKNHSKSSKILIEAISLGKLFRSHIKKIVTNEEKLRTYYKTLWISTSLG